MLTTWKLVLYCCCFLIVAARGRDADRKRGKPPLIEEPEKKNKNRQSHCTFGNLTYGVEERWKPDLGPPFGILFCLHCECAAVRKKKRVTAKVKCRNIKYDCPKPTCPNPVLLPSRCCKTCPGQDYADLEEDLASKKLEDDDENIMKEFSALLTGRGLTPNVFTRAAARGYFVFYKRTLHYTIHYSGLDSPSFIRFTDEEGMILEEQEVIDSPKFINASKVCGVWRNVPKVYRRLLNKDRLHTVLITDKHPDGQVSGKLLKSMRFNTEVYSSLLLSEDGSAGSGGIAMISPVQENVHVIIDFNGIFSPKDTHDVEIFVRINNRDEDSLLAEAVVIMPKVHPEHNRANVKMTLTNEILHFLNEGKLELIVNSTEAGKTLRGPIITKPTCNVFQAVLTAGGMKDADDDNELLDRQPAGFALFTVNNDGTISYKLHTIDLESPPSLIKFQTNAKDGTDLEIEQLNYTSGWANGTFVDTSAQVTEMLMTDDLYLSIPTLDHLSELQGRVHQRYYTEAFTSDMPFLLLPEKNSSAAGIAWLSIDKDCFLHYEVDVSKLDHLNRKKSERRLVELVHKSRYNLQQQVLKKLDGDEVGDMADIQTVNILRSGVSELLITTKIGREKTIELKGTIEKVYVPANCLLRSDHNRYKTSNPFVDDSSIDVFYDPTSQCYYEDNVFEDGSQWKAQHNNCLMCSCQRGKITCENIICPQPICDNPVLLQNSCCPECFGSNDNSTEINITQGCYLSGQFYIAGSRWHPYIPPFGFSTCVVCTCQTETFRVDCKKTTCPPLTCPESQAYREYSYSCCKKCPQEVAKNVTVIQKSLTGTVSDEGRVKSPKDILLEGGCLVRGRIHVNGAEWHPTIQPYGEVKCVHCHCKDGEQKCRRQKCPKLNCKATIHPESDCCPRCLDINEYHTDNHSSRREKRRRKTKNKHSFISHN